VGPWNGSTDRQLIHSRGQRGPVNYFWGRC